MVFVDSKTKEKRMRIFKRARDFITATTLFTLVTFASTNVKAQEGVGGFFGGALRDLLIITGAGVGGCVIGLSTLSFVDEPGDNMKNIVNGGAIGVMIGVGVVIFGHAGKSKILYDSALIDSDKTKDFFEASRLFAETNKKSFGRNPPLYFNYKFTF